MRFNNGVPLKISKIEQNGVVYIIEKRYYIYKTINSRKKKRMK